MERTYQVEQSANKMESPGPKDRSLAAYKAWILTIARRLTTKTSQVELTDEEWLVFWKEYWREKFGS